MKAAASSGGNSWKSGQASMARLAAWRTVMPGRKLIRRATNRPIQSSEFKGATLAGFGDPLLSLATVPRSR
ncbi:hypothetical protein BH11PSE8_BH11PSE8_07220 [soil metagenome]